MKATVTQPVPHRESLEGVQWYSRTESDERGAGEEIVMTSARFRRGAADNTKTQNTTIRNGNSMQRREFVAHRRRANRRTHDRQGLAESPPAPAG